MNISPVELTGVFIAGIEIGVLLCLIVQTATRHRREWERARRQSQLEIEALRRDFEALRPEIERLRQWRQGSS